MGSNEHQHVEPLAGASDGYAGSKPSDVRSESASEAVRAVMPATCDVSAIDAMLIHLDYAISAMHKIGSHKLYKLGLLESRHEIEKAMDDLYSSLEALKQKHAENTDPATD